MRDISAAETGPEHWSLQKFILYGTHSRAHKEGLMLRLQMYATLGFYVGNINYRGNDTTKALTFYARRIIPQIKKLI